MAWCEKEECGKDNLLKAEVVFDELTKKVLCMNCFISSRGSDALPLVEDDSQVSYDISLNSRNGFKAVVSFGDVSVAFHTPAEKIQKWLK